MMARLSPFLLNYKFIEMILPEAGSVVLLDDNIHEALPIMKAFSKQGVPLTYYQGIVPEELPAAPSQSIRLAIVDLQLIRGENDGHTIASRLVDILTRIISRENGPYILLVWSRKDGLFLDDVRREISNEAHGIVPVAIVPLNKTECIETVISEQPIDNATVDEIVSDIDLITPLEDGDVDSIRELIRLKTTVEIEPEYRARPDAISRIEAELVKHLVSSDIFHLFVIWENLLKKSATSIVNDISSLIQTDTHWNDNMKKLFSRMAAARVGQNSVSSTIMLQESINVLNSTYIDKVESGIKSYTFPNGMSLHTDIMIGQTMANANYSIRANGTEFVFYREEDRIIANENIDALKKTINKDQRISADQKTAYNSLWEKYLRIPPSLNTKLHIELTPSQELIPGNIYLRNELDEPTKAKYLMTFFETLQGEKTKTFKDKSVEEKTAFINAFFHGENATANHYTLIDLEVSPICDYAQKKWKRSRTLPGVLYRADYTAMEKNYFYNVQPVFELDGELYKLAFDFHLFNAMDKANASQRVVTYRLKRELLLDIIAQLSAHVNRPGISFVQ